MNTYKISEFIKYKFKALSSHGVHSPFVFNFIINIIENKTSPANFIKSISDLPELNEIEKKYQSILLNIIKYFEYNNIINADFLQKNTGSKFDLLILSENKLQEWAEICEIAYIHIHKDSCIVVNNIYNSIFHTKEWQKLYLNPNVKLSIDLFGIGLLFFKEEFKEKQHFNLKC